SPETPWYHGPTLMEHLETVEIEDEVTHHPMRMPVQWVNRPNLDFRGFSGPIVSGEVRPGDQVRVLPSGARSSIKDIVTMDGNLDQAILGQAVTLTLNDEIDISRGDVLCAADSPLAVSDQFAAHIVWFAEDAMLPERTYLCRIGTSTVQVRITKPKYKVNVNTLEKLAADTLEVNEIGQCNISFSRRVPFAPYQENRELGGFLIIDRITNATVGAGMIDHSLRRADNIHWQSVDVGREQREDRNGHKAVALWFTGRSGAGKSTIANVVEKHLHARGVHTYLLDGDNVRHGLSQDLGFTDADRVENIRRVGEVTRLFVDSGVVVLTALISPFSRDRNAVRERIGVDDFCEIYVDASQEVAAERDPKGLYKKAAEGDMKYFTGLDSSYEAPENPDIHLDTTLLSPEEAATKVITWLRDNKKIR
ncbi:MAG: adenylyl-sulfate kinase, partial [Propionibacterium sp.]|nr:adenylyl-sulfate kinase [Propionibacterium sp.]